MSGIFNTLYNLRLKSHNNPLEDYLTEIFAYCLSNDGELLNSFLKDFKMYQGDIEDATVTTQYSLKALKNHKTDSRPDMVLFSDDATLFFEHKIGAGEGYGQLQRYAEHLNEVSSDQQKVLVYITRDYDPKEKNKIFENCSKQNGTIDIIQIRWFQIFQFLKPFREDPLVFELLTFMKKIKLSMSNQFSPEYILTLNNFSKVLKLMDETMFGEVKKRFIEINGGVSQESACSTQLRKKDRYIYWRDHYEGFKVGLGFWMNSDNDKSYPEIGVMMQIKPSSKCRNEIVSIFEKVRKEKDSVWTLDPSKWPSIYSRVSIQTFLSKEDQVGEIKKYFFESLNEVQEIFNTYPQLPVRNKETN